MARIYANENFPMPVVVELRGRGHDVLTLADTGHAGRSWPDREVLLFAHREARALLTLNRTMMHSLFDVGQLRVERTAPSDLVRAIEAARPIEAVFSG